MFETSKAAGIASYQQWGLDAGNHQGGWSPYPSVPEGWNLSDIPEAEDIEYQACSLSLLAHNECPILFLFKSTVLTSVMETLLNPRRKLQSHNPNQDQHRRERTEGTGKGIEKEAEVLSNC
jgi:hypothetical protein